MADVKAPVFSRATRSGARLRMGLAGPAGSGKTYTALLLAVSLAGPEGAVALIDTEHGSASKVAGTFQFDVLELDSFHPQKYMDAIAAAESSGYSVLVIDSLSHAWSGRGGLLEEKERIAAVRYQGNSFRSWMEASAIQNNLVDAILSSKMHVIATIRSKMDYVVEEDEKGRHRPRRVGLAPVQRDDLPYEFDIFATMDGENVLTIEKSRCAALPANTFIQKPDAALAKTLSAWLSEGGAVPETPQPAPQSTLEYIRTGMEALAKQGTVLDAGGRPATTVAAVRDACLAVLGFEGPIGALDAEHQEAVRVWTAAAVMGNNRDEEHAPPA